MDDEIVASGMKGEGAALKTRLGKAERTLERAGYVRNELSGEWKPPTNGAAKEARELRDRVAELESELREKEPVNALRLDPDSLSNFILGIDGRHQMGAGELAERICEYIAAAEARRAGHSLGFPVLMTIFVTRPHGTYWAALRIADGTSIAFTGETPMDAVMKTFGQTTPDVRQSPPPRLPLAGEKSDTFTDLARLLNEGC